MKLANNKKKCVVLILLSFFILQIFSGFLNTNVNLENSNINQQEGDETNLGITSDLPPFEFLTPENKTYLEPDEGYFPATYGFEDQKSSVSGKDIEFVDWVNDVYTQVKIESSEEGHNKFISITRPEQWGEIYNNFTDQLAGTTARRRARHLVDGGPAPVDGCACLGGRAFPRGHDRPSLASWCLHQVQPGQTRLAEEIARWRSISDIWIAVRTQYFADLRARRQIHGANPVQIGKRW